MKLLDNSRLISPIDREGMLARAAALPDQALAGWRMGLGWRVPKHLKARERILVLGMGGSAIGADLASGILGDRLKRPFAVNRNYTLPGWVGPETLALACSYSGNTEETLSAAEAARKQKASLAVITSGGELASWAGRHGIPLLRIPTGWPPRSAVGFLTFAPLGLFVQLKWVSRRQLPVEQACAGLERFIRTRLQAAVRTASNPAKRLAKIMEGRLPVLYGAAGGWEGVTYRWRTQIEENAKSLAFHHLFPEATHNEISGWVEPRALMKRSAAVFLTDREVHPRTLKRMQFTQKLVRRQGARAAVCSAPGHSRLERMLKLISLGDFTSIYLAFLYRQDPTPVVRVEALKRYLIQGHNTYFKNRSRPKIGIVSPK